MPAEVAELPPADLLAPIPVPAAILEFASFERHVSNAGKAGERYGGGNWDETRWSFGDMLARIAWHHPPGR